MIKTVRDLKVILSCGCASGLLRSSFGKRRCFPKDDRRTTEEDPKKPPPIPAKTGQKLPKPVITGTLQN